MRESSTTTRSERAGSAEAHARKAVETMKTVTFVLLFLFSYTPTKAQTHKVSVMGETPNADRVVSALKSKLGGTLRYQLTDKVTAELLVSVQCAEPSPVMTGFICDATFLYYPSFLKGMNVHLGASLSTGKDADEVADSFFEGFIGETTDEHLAEIVSAYKTVCGPR